VQARDNVTDRSKPPVAPQPPREHPKADKPKPVGPNSQNNIQDRHFLEDAIAGVNAIGAIASVIATIFDIAGWVLLLTGVGASFTPLAFLIGKIAGAVGAIAGCISSLADAAKGAFKATGIGGCLLSVVAAAIGKSLQSVKEMITGLTRRDRLDAVRAFERVAAGIGVNFDLTGLLLTISGWVADV
jgi:hypothetical protein